MGRYGSDVAATAVLMLSFGAASQERYLLAYIIATAMGAVSGAAINTLLWPPLYHRRPDAAFRRLAEQGAALLGDVADGLRQGWDLSGLAEWQAQATRLTERLDAAEAAVAAGAESRRYNLRRLTAPPGRDHTPQGWAVSGSLLTDAHRIMILLADGHDPTMVAPAQGPH
ncbi:hypothetical protein [Nonomuraea sp. NPDC049750]|uniref:hypothetical protein n=1 Tax=Nonomuraea sp. NPDC049750 TaxID=3154738 RepID=UPI0033C4B673